jgi:predicted DNA-binding protein
MPKIVESNKANVHQVNTKVSASLIQKIEQVASSKNITKSEVIRQAIKAKLNE